MRLLRLADVEQSRNDRVFSYSRITASLLATIAIAAGVALLLRAYSANWKAGYYLAAVIILFAALLKTFVTARFRPSNWLVRMTDLGIFIQFRSYLNYHLPADDLTVVFLSFGEICSARFVRERAQVSDAEGNPTTQTLRHVELELAGDVGPLATALETELVEKAPTVKHWYGRSSTLYEDHPVQMQSPPFLRLRWQAVPGAHKFLDALSSYTTISDPVLISQDFTHLESLTPEEQRKRLRDLAQRGETISAIYLAPRLYGFGLEEAREKINALRQNASAAV